jgi:hypothetical protein
VEKASIDEVYIDVTSMVEAELQSLGAGASAADAGGDAGATAGFGEILSLWKALTCGWPRVPHSALVAMLA